jgi:hypothetical protein
MSRRAMLHKPAIYSTVRQLAYVCCYMALILIKMKTLEATVTYKYKLEIDDNNDIVKEYESENELLVDCASYRFGIGLPVIGGGGVKVKDVELVEVS